MQKPILHDPIFLSRPSRPATKDDLAVARDLADTLSAHADHCVGLAANMIGESVCILAVLDGCSRRVKFAKLRRSKNANSGRLKFANLSQSKRANHKISTAQIGCSGYG